MALFGRLIATLAVLLLVVPQVQAKNEIAQAAKKRAKKNCSDTLSKLRQKYKSNNKAMKYVNAEKTKSACEDAIYVQMGVCSKAFYRAINEQTKGKRLSKNQLAQISKPLSEKMKTCMARSILQTTTTIEKGAAESAKL